MRNSRMVFENTIIGGDSMKRKISKILLTSLILMFTLTTSAFAGSLYLNVPGTVQEEDNWCWAASSVCALNYDSLGVTQTQFVTYVKGSPVDEAGWPWEVQSGLEHWNVDNDWTTGSISWANVTDDINDYAPIIASIAWSPWWEFEGHMLAIYGYYEDQYVKNVSYMDPWSSNPRWNSRTYGSFVSNSDWTWSGTNYNLIY
ncbi:hypothetical protein Desmer_3043 [Desulfosporosinus meridiei DSM 13257]|uniref:Peptidase C39-like domain-containing protein n=2 Tax=Desulfosporosinus TaxID=79206 RepID=J7J1U1_DESMD|nr:hypothetical protein Desmer_3043 [Desulfosporosinus meridiei DSM 13257]